jgi:hypothetical protein
VPGDDDDADEVVPGDDDDDEVVPGDDNDWLTRWTSGSSVGWLVRQAELLELFCLSCMICCLCKQLITQARQNITSTWLLTQPVYV